MVEQIFLLQQVKESVVFSKKWYIWFVSRVTERLKPYDLRKLRNIKKVSKLLPSSQSSYQNENFVTTSKNLLRNKTWTYFVVWYFTWKPELFSKVLWMIQDSIYYLFCTHDVLSDLYTHIDIYHYSIFDLNHILYHQIYIYICMIYSLLMFSVHLFL